MLRCLGIVLFWAGDSLASYAEIRADWSRSVFPFCGLAGLASRPGGFASGQCPGPSAEGGSGLASLLRGAVSGFILAGFSGDVFRIWIFTLGQFADVRGRGDGRNEFPQLK